MQVDIPPSPPNTRRHRPWTPGLTTMFFGAILAAFYLWYRDIVANILAHVVIDFVGIVLPTLL